MDKAEIQRELDHVNKVLKIAHDNRRVLEQQQVQQGMIAPLNLINQTNEIKSAIQELEERKNNLEIQAVEEDYSLAEAEYRLAVAEAWKEAKLSTYSKIHLELLRLKLKIEIEHAEHLEKLVRVDLSKEFLGKIDVNSFFRQSTLLFWDTFVSAVALDIDIALDVVNEVSKGKEFSNEITDLVTNNIHRDSIKDNSRKVIMEYFFDKLRSLIKIRDTDI